MKFKLKINCDNAAFKSEDGSNDAMATEYEVIRILGVVSERVWDGDMGGPVLDVNGNTVGAWMFS